MTNQYENMTFGGESGATHVEVITPSDTTDLNTVMRGIAFSTAGTIKIKAYDNQVVTIPSGVLAPGIIHSIFVKRIYQTGTTATNIIGVY